MTDTCEFEFEFESEFELLNLKMNFFFFTMCQARERRWNIGSFFIDGYRINFFSNFY